MKTTAEEINIQNEVEKIHKQYGISEKANYKIQLLFEEFASLKEEKWISEIERRQELIISEPNGIVRETMIYNLLMDLPLPPKEEK